MTKKLVLTDKKDHELLELLAEQGTILANGRFQFVSGNHTELDKYRQAKKMIARVKTLLGVRGHKK